MNYDDAVAYLLTLGRELASPRQPAPRGMAGARAQKFGLENITALAERLGAPHRACPCAHIAGTNGKGSVAAMLDSILRAAGLTTGLYISPHLERINERIQVDGAEIADADFAAAFTRVLAAIEALLAEGALAAHPTYFECLTAMAFDHFARASAPAAGHSQLTPQPSGCHSERSEESAVVAQAGQGTADSSPGFVGVGTTRRGVDFAVFEVGMGGRLDATNIVAPEVAVITRIDFDHEDYLGHSIEEIAAEKAGIIKPGAWVVSAAGRPEARAVVARRCAELDARLVDVESAYRVTITPANAGCNRVAVEAAHSRRRIEFTLPLAGRYQAVNAAAAIAAARLLAERGFPVTDEAIVQGLEAVRWPGRLERVQDVPAVYLDGTHNPSGARELAAFWQEHFAGRRMLLVYGAVRDKAVDEITGLLFPLAWRVYVTQPRQARAISAALVARMTQHLTPPGGAEVFSEPEAALDAAVAAAAPGDVVLATGSLYLAGDLRRHWRARSAVPSAQGTR